MNSMSPSPSTSQGDSGFSSLPGLPNLPKSHVLFEALGAIDETNASLGLLLASLPPQSRPDWIPSAQRHLLSIGAEIASASPRLPPDAVDSLSRVLAALDDSLPPANGFSIPGNNEPSARAHVARATCRRAERACILAREFHPDRASPRAAAFLNRLSSLLFSFARSLENPP